MTAPVDLVDELIAAWTEHEKAAARPPRHPSARWLEPETRRKAAAIAALGLQGSRCHETVAAWRRRGYDVPSAVQAAINESLALQEVA